jgi:hypothetical protein
MQRSGSGLALLNASSAVDVSVAFTNQSTLTFPHLALVAGDFFFINNAAINVSFPVLTAVVGDFVVSYNVFLVSFHAAGLKNIGGVVSVTENNIRLVIVFSSSLKFEVFCAGGSGPESADLQGCTRVIDIRQITGSLATAVTSSLLTSTGRGLDVQINAFLGNINLPSLTYIGGYLLIRSNPVLDTINLSSLRTVTRDLETRSNAVLATINLPSLSTVVGDLQIFSNPSLTFVHLPKLTFIGSRISLCANNALFRIPSGPPDAPTSGLVVGGSYKGTNSCQLQGGSGTCNLTVTCP